jgi:hypothetical protein
MRSKQLLATAVFMLALPVMVLAQATSSAINGVVRDPSSAVISGAEITVTNTDTGISRSATSNASGLYRVGELIPGKYQVTAAMAGFSKETRKDVVLLVGQELNVNFALQVGGVEQEIVVTGEAPVIETTVSAVASNVTQEQLRELPLNGRAFTDLVTLNPGAVTPHVAQGRGANYGFANQLSVAGARTDSNSFRIDGSDMMDTRNMNPGSAAGVQLGVDTIREFQVITANAKAEYGRNSGAVINAVSRSGTNDLHGSLFEFLRNNKLDARRFENRGELPPFKRNQFGGTVGGPITRDKTFFFLGYEGLRQRLNESAVYNVPTADGRRGIGVGPGGSNVTVDPRIVPYMNLYPLPNDRIIGDGTGLLAIDESRPTTEDFGSARIDYSISSADSFFGRYTVSKAESNSNQNLLSGQLSTTSRHLATLQEDHIFGPALVNTLRISFNRSIGYSAPAQTPGGENLGFAPGVPLGEIGAGTQVSNIGPASIGIVDDTQNTFQYEDAVTYTRGNHTMKFGALAQRFQWNTDNPAFWQGQFSFPDLRTMLTLGNANATYRLPISSTNRGLRTWLMGFYGQTDYRVSPNLTLNLGLRWEFTTGVSEVNGNISYLARGPIDSTPADLTKGKLWQNHIKNFQPRIGFNWSLNSAQTSTLSGGFGIFHNQVLHNSFVSFRDQLPFNFRAAATNVPFAAFPNIEQVVLQAGQNFNASRHFDFDNFKTPTYYRYNLTIQHQLPGELVAKIGYVGSVARHLARRQLLNVFPNPVVRSDGSLFFPCGSLNVALPPTATCPNPVYQAINRNFGRIEWMSSDVNSSYNSLTAGISKRFTRGVTFSANYTWSKSIDDYSQSETNFAGETGANAQYGPDRVLDRARSTFNVPHVFVANGVWELPVGQGKTFLNSGGVADAILGGWQVGGILTLQQGLPFTIGSAISDAGYTFKANRPNMKPGIDINTITSGVSLGCNRVGSPIAAGTKVGTRDLYFDPCAFDMPAAGTIGNVTRNTIIGPDLRNVNFNLNKSFRIREGMSLQYRAEFFNLFNRAQLRNPAARAFSFTRRPDHGIAGRQRTANPDGPEADLLASSPHPPHGGPATAGPLAFRGNRANLSSRPPSRVILNR